MRRIVTTLLVAISTSLIIPGAPKKAAPADLSLSDLNGQKVRLRDYRGKIVVLNFWATWCGPCREEMPMLVEAEKKWGARGVAFIGASLDDKGTRKNIPEFVKQYQIAFPVWVGASGDDLDKLRMGNAVPDTVFLDEDGAIFARIRGEARPSEVDERLDWATGDRSRPAPEPLVTHLEH